MSKTIDLTGDKFGCWTVLKRSDRRGGHASWICECKCGKQKDVIGVSLTGGHTTSCGCGRLPDLRNKQFGDLLVKHKIDNKAQNKDILWLCVCVCGKAKEIRGRYLISGAIKSCGCSRHTDVDLLGQKIGDWTVKSKITLRGMTHWICECKCGKQKEVRHSHLVSGDSKGCGCKNRRPNGMSAAHGLYTSYRLSASKRKRVFNIDEENFIQICQNKCFYCGDNASKEFGTKHNNGYFIYNGLDRVDNNRGYEMDNVVPCCEKCNRMKLQLDVKEFVQHCKKIAKLASHNLLMRGSSSEGP